MTGWIQKRKNSRQPRGCRFTYGDLAVPAPSHHTMMERRSALAEVDLGAATGGRQHAGRVAVGEEVADVLAAGARVVVLAGVGCGRRRINVRSSFCNTPTLPHAVWFQKVSIFSFSTIER